MNEFCFIAALLAALVIGCLLGYLMRALRPWPYAVMVMALFAGVGTGASGLLSAGAVVVLGCIGMIVGSLAEPSRGG